MGKLFVGIYNYFEKHRRVFVLTFIFSFLFTGYFAFKINLEEDISKILPQDKKIEKLNDIFRNSHFIDRLVITISLKDSAVVQPDSLIDFSDRLAELLQNNYGGFLRRINSRTNDSLVFGLLNTIRNHLPVFLNDQDYLSIDSLTAPGKLKETLLNNLKTLNSPAGIAIKSTIVRDPAGITFLALKKLKQLQVDDNFDVYDNHILTKDHKNAMVFLTPAFPPENTGMNEKLLRGLDSSIALLNNQGFANIDASYFGAAAVSAGNAKQIRKDTTITQGITLLFLILFIGFYFHRKRAPFLILLPVGFGALFSLCLLYFIKGGISVIAIATGSVVFGIAVNYSLHVFNHYRHTKDVRRTLEDLAEPMTIGSFTTVGGFFCLEFVKSEMLRDVGLFTAFSLVGAALFSLIFLPYFLGSAAKEKASRPVKLLKIDKLFSFRSKYRGVFVLIIFLLTIIFSFFSSNVTFESDMMKMNYMNDTLKASQEKLNSISSYSLQSMFLVTEGKTLNEALENNEKIITKIEALRNNKTISNYSGVSSLLISDSLQNVRLNKWKNYWTNDKKQNLLTALSEEGSKLKFSHSAFIPFSQMLDQRFEKINSAELSDVRKNFLDDFISERADKSSVITVLKVDHENKKVIYKAFGSDPGVTILDKEYLTTRLVEIIQSDFLQIAIMTSSLVFLVLILTYGRIELALVSFVPMFITWIWILGLMSIFNVPFNIINIIISALVFGLGDDYSLFIMDGLLKEYKNGRKNLDSYKSSILLSAITVVAGLGILIFAKHPALRSIALISIIGIGSVLFTSMILIPFLFEILITNRTKNGKLPWTFTGLLKSAFAFSYFALGCILLLITGIILIRLNPFGKKGAKLIYHTILSGFAWSLMYIMVNVKKKIINEHDERFQTPAVMICNHQSFLDILATIMLHPKLILLTNDWVWNSPVFGAVVRMADYYPVSRGIENSLELLRKKVDEGYSIIIFPEGTRSLTGKIGRFHKGAFFLAEQLQIDILPLLIHGTGHTMSKNDFLLKDGRITLKFLPRIKYNDNYYGDNYSERGKSISRYFKHEYELLKNEIETTADLRQQLIYNYIYKGPVLEWYARIKTRLENNYQLIDRLIPRTARILDAGCGYGFISYMLKMKSPARVITGIDYDEEKVATANLCFSKTHGINFAANDINDFTFGKYDAVILADVLHYLLPYQQKKIIAKSISSIADDGIIIIRDGNTDLKKRHQGTKLSELFSTKIFSFNKTVNELNFISGNLIHEMAVANNMTCEEIDQTSRTSNIIYILKRKDKIEKI